MLTESCSIYLAVSGKMGAVLNPSDDFSSKGGSIWLELLEPPN
jgi:hypothetical protein